MSDTKRGCSCILTLGICSIIIVLMGVGLSIFITKYEFDDNQIDFDFKEIPCVEVHASSKLFKGKVAGGESLLHIGDGKIISGMDDGRVMELDIKKNTVKTLFKTENSRPLGMRRINETAIGVVDAFLGFYIYDLKTQKKEPIIRNGDLVENIPIVFLDDFAYSAKRHMVYITEASLKYGVHEILDLYLHGGRHGRIITVDLNTKEIGVLSQKFVFPNGIEISKDENFLLINEENRFQTHKYDLNSNIFTTIATFPAYLDNIRRDSGDGYWVAAIMVNFRHPYYLEKYTMLRALASLLGKLNIISIYSILQDHGSFVHIDENGKIDKCFYSNSGMAFNHVSELLEHNGFLYAGSYCPKVDYIAQIKI